MSIFCRLKRIIWNKWIKLWWCRLWVRKETWHASLDFDYDAISVMKQEELEKYRKDLYGRITIAHKNYLERTKGGLLGSKK